MTRSITNIFGGNLFSKWKIAKTTRRKVCSAYVTLSTMKLCHPKPMTTSPTGGIRNRRAFSHWKFREANSLLSVNTYCIIKYIFTLTVWKQNEYGNIVENHNQMLLQEEYKACKQSIILSNKMTEVNWWTIVTAATQPMRNHVKGNKILKMKLWKTEN